MQVTLDKRIGTELGGYRIVEALGSGATSVVYRAEHVRLGRQAALKLLTPAFGEADFRERFLRESQLAASLDHPSIVPVYDAGDEDGLLYIAMACVEGRDLKTVLADEGRLPLRRALRIVGQIGSALDAAHARGLVHRDVKPANILVADDDRAYLTDFGVVKDLASNGKTRTGSFVGTIEYGAPEQIEGREVDGRADVYALACVLYECLAGTPPFHRPSEVAVLISMALHTLAILSWEQREWLARFPQRYFLLEQLEKPDLHHLGNDTERILNVASEYIRLGLYSRASSSACEPRIATSTLKP